MYRRTPNRLTMLFAIGVWSLSLFAAPSLLVAQTNHPSRHWLSPGLSDEISNSGLTKAGGQIVSFPCDPMMSMKQEREISVALLQESPFQWAPGTPLSEMAADLSNLFPVLLDSRALEEIGIDADTEIGPGVMINGGRHSPKRTTQRARWWQSSEKSTANHRPSLITDVMNHLQNLDLTLMILRGQVVITTVEAAEDDAATRIYDVTPIVNVGNQAPWDSSHWSTGNSELYADFDSLINLLETNVTPDTWEALGGNSTIATTTIRDRHWIVISTTTMTHWKIQRLLDRLNQS